jgi:hypothetical protein
LPWFLRHAHWSTYLAGAVVFLVVMMLGTAWRRRVARRRVAAALAPEPAAPAAWRDGDPVAVRGILRAERPVTTIAVLGFALGTELVEHAPAAPEAAVEVEGVPVRLDGPVVIDAGSRVVRHHAIPTAHFEAASVARDKVRRAMQLGMWKSGIDAYHLRHVAPGDEVIARGRLARAGDGAWHLTPPGPLAPITLAATRAVVDPPPAPPLGSMARAALAGVATWVLLALLTR